jgi:hypothetical protein
MKLAGKTLFITGASRGIGLAIAKRAAADGAWGQLQLLPNGDVFIPSIAGPKRVMTHLAQ